MKAYEYDAYDNDRHHPRCLIHPDNLEESYALLAQDEIAHIECTCAVESER